jgi:large subunit ribosomal protein L20|tara:strand:+ start:112 stop:453 length:342 start_codon:yes stop_codon:yes gene_type:complete
MRVKTSVASKRRKKRLLKQTKGFWGQRKNVFRRAKETLLRSMAYSYRDRKAKKRTMRSLWITRINAALREEGYTYSKFIHAMKTKEIDLDRRVLAELAVNHPEKFKQLIQSIN